MVALRNQTARAVVRRPGLRWAIASAAAAVLALGWPSQSSQATDPFLQPRPPLTAQKLAGIWKTPSFDYVVTLHVQPRGADSFELTSVVDNWWKQSVTRYHARAQAIGLGTGSSALLMIESGAPPFRSPGYFVASYTRNGPTAAPIVRRRDTLLICPIAEAALIDAIRSGQVEGRIGTRAGHAYAVLADSPRGLNTFLSSRSELLCRIQPDAFFGVRVSQSRQPAVRIHRSGGAT